MSEIKFTEVSEDKDADNYKFKAVSKRISFVIRIAGTAQPRINAQLKEKRATIDDFLNKYVFEFKHLENIFDEDTLLITTNEVQEMMSLNLI